MHRITVESALGEQPAKLPGEVILCDSNGRALGFFLPCKMPRKQLTYSLSRHFRLQKLKNCERFAQENH